MHLCCGIMWIGLTLHVQPGKHILQALMPSCVTDCHKSFVSTTKYFGFRGVGGCTNIFVFKVMWRCPGLNRILVCANVYELCPSVQQSLYYYSLKVRSALGCRCETNGVFWFCNRKICLLLTVYGLILSMVACLYSCFGTVVPSPLFGVPWSQYSWAQYLKIPY